ncbi:hypothetical protein [Hydrogenophaga sp. NFH-34]|uniref:hypothetical protein n=1 Tax=Hydrogenophaga sp. NFH-34 TaxID=2744446 RepID=UPI001F320C1A|nr:hypothetical protein [Hydrogenophaga sp. NFH-34]
MNAHAQQKPEAGEFWLARFVFDEGDDYKIRPVLVLESSPFGTKVAFCGTQKIDETSSRKDVLLDEEEARLVGLLKATRICFGNRRVISSGDMLRKLGELGSPGQRLSTLKFREMAQAVQAAGAL